MVNHISPGSCCCSGNSVHVFRASGTKRNYLLAKSHPLATLPARVGADGYIMPSHSVQLRYFLLRLLVAMIAMSQSVNNVWEQNLPPVLGWRGVATQRHGWHAHVYAQSYVGGGAESGTRKLLPARGRHDHTSARRWLYARGKESTWRGRVAALPTTDQ